LFLKDLSNQIKQMSCCASAGGEELPVEKFAGVLMLIKDSNPQSQYDSVLKACGQVLELVEHRATYNRPSQKQIDSLVKDVMARKRKLGDDRRLRRRLSRPKTGSNSSLVSVGEEDSDDEKESQLQSVAVDRLVKDVQKRKRFLDNRLRRQKRKHNTA
jgi:hypothetical protein